MGQVKAFQERNPTFAHKRRALGENKRLATPETVDEFIGGSIQNAGYDLLESIHQDIFDKKTDAEKLQITEDLKLLALEAKEETVKVKGPKPELNDDYLRSIGREDLIYWPSGRD